MIVILQLTSLLWITKYTPENYPMHLMVSSFTGIFITMTYGLICSASWYLTTSSIILTSLIALSYYNYIYHFFDVRSNSILSITVLMLSFFIYTIEKKEKFQFLNYQQIQRMNIELKNILMKFPEGIVLIDEDGEVCLKN